MLNTDVQIPHILQCHREYWCYFKVCSSISLAHANWNTDMSYEIVMISFFLKNYLFGRHEWGSELHTISWAQDCSISSALTLNVRGPS